MPTFKWCMLKWTICLAVVCSAFAVDANAAKARADIGRFVVDQGGQEGTSTTLLGGDALLDVLLSSLDDVQTDGDAHLTRACALTARMPPRIQGTAPPARPNPHEHTT